ncbi:uncharacterized protein mrvi1 isoform X4 [Gadus macrocephalus]|uniref:uncharacterized protein mrvi1 isoform X4 n=1 Tax=Gadus macrocephalus TaxID=80720 RepID=UPI0028CB85A8|nr:uncharacterized protein mrvi1 isoform X4 [Gadus macrocephalus]
MTSRDILNTQKMFHVPSSLGPCEKRQDPATENNPFQTKHEGRSLSRDSGVSSTEIEIRSQMSDSGDASGSASPFFGQNEPLVDTGEISGLSEHELLDITYDACNTKNTGKVLASTIMQYLQAMTGQSAEQDKLIALRRMLDPDCQDHVVSRETFHSTMKEWIAQCHQESTDVEDPRAPWPEASKVSNGLDFSSPQSVALPETVQCFCDSKELLGTVTELKCAHHKLTEQNGRLLKMVAQCEDANLQLSAEIIEMRSKVASGQRAVARARSLSAELEDAHREAQDKASRTQTSCTKLSNEVECLKVHVRILEDKNDKLAFEKICSEDSINKLRKVNSELRVELEETLIMLTLRDREISMRDSLMDKMKTSHVENCNIIEGLQSELSRLQEHSKQALLRFDRPFSSLHSLHGRSGESANHRSLHTEIQDIQQPHYASVEEMRMPSLHIQKDGLHSIIHRIKTAELAHCLHTNYAERDSFSSENQERPYAQSPLQQASIKQQLVNVLRELELPRSAWEDKGDKVQDLGQNQSKPKTHSQSPALAPAPGARNVAVVNWWRALNVEGTKTRTSRDEDSHSCQALCEARTKLQQAERTIGEMKVHLRHLQAALKTEQEHVIECQTTHAKTASPVLHTRDEETNTDTESRSEAALVLNTRDAETNTDPESRTEAALVLNTRDEETNTDPESRTEAALVLNTRDEETNTDPESRSEAALVLNTRDAETNTDPESRSEAALVLNTRDEETNTDPESRTEAALVLNTRDEETNTDPESRTEAAQVLNTRDEETNTDPESRTEAALVLNTRDEETNTDTESRTEAPLVLNTRDAETNTDPESRSEAPPIQELVRAREVKDAAVGPDLDKDNARRDAAERQGVAHGLAADGLLASLRKMEALISGALETAEGVRQSEQRVSLVRERMESIAQKVREALGRAADTDLQLSALEARGLEGDQAVPTAPIASQCLVSIPADSTVTADTGPTYTEPLASPPPPLSPPMSQEAIEQPLTNGDKGQENNNVQQQEEERRPIGSGVGLSGRNPEKTCEAPCVAEAPFIFPHTRSRPTQLPTMPTLPEEEEDSPEEVDSSSSSPSTYVAGESQAVVMTAPTIVFPQKATVVLQEGHPLDLARPHSPRSRLSRTSLSGTPITTVDSAGQVIDLVKDALQEPQLSEEERLKNLDLLEQAKKVSDRFLTRRGRRSTCSLTEAPTGLTPNPTPPPSPSRAVGAAEVSYAATQSASPVKDQPNVPTQEQEGARLLVDWKPAEKRKVSSGTLTPRYAVQKENCDPSLAKKSIPAPASPVAAAAPTAGGRPEEGTSGPGRSPTQAPATGVAKPVPRLPTQQAPCTAEIKTIGAFPPLMRAVSWDTVGTLNSRNGAPPPAPGPEEVFTFPDKSRDGQSKQSGYKDFPAQPVATQKLSKLREEHKLLRNQSIVGSTLPELSETSEHEKGLPSPTSPGGEDVKEKTDSMPNISDVMLRKLKLHRGLPGCAPPLTEKEVENAFVQLSLAYRNDNYTLETRMKQAERERHLTEENTEKELEEFKGALKMTSPQWQNLEQREAYQRLIETVSVLHRLATRLSSRAEIVGAVRQEKRMNKATEVMMQYVENLKRTYEKDHAELMEFKKLANQNSIRCYGGSIDTGDDGVPRPSRSMSLTLGKALPRRRVSVAVVPKFNLLNIPGQTPAGPIPAPSYGPPPPSAGASGPLGGAALPVLCEATDSKGNASPVEAGQPTESGSRVSAPEGEPAAPAKPAVNVEELRAEIRAELKAKMEEEYYNKGYQEGLNKSKESQEICEEPEKVQATLLQSGNKDEESGKRSMAKKSSSKMQEVLVLLDRYWPKISWRHRPFWIALTLCLVIFLVVNVFTYLNGYNNSHVDSAEKALVQGKKKIFGLTVAAQPKNPTTE